VHIAQEARRAPQPVASMEQNPQLRLLHSAHIISRRPQGVPVGVYQTRLGIAQLLWHLRDGLDVLLLQGKRLPRRRVQPPIQWEAQLISCGQTSGSWSLPSTLYGPEIKNGWSYTSTTLHAFIACRGTSCLLYLHRRLPSQKGLAWLPYKHFWNSH
jgi:hypothetical protein